MTSAVDGARAITGGYLDGVSGRSNFTLSAWNGMRDGRSGVQFEMSGPDAKAHFHLVEQRHRDAVEDRLSGFGPIEWRLMPNAKVSQIRIIRPGSPADRTTWPELDQWMADALEAMRLLFSPIVKTLNAEAWVPGDDAAEGTLDELPQDPRHLLPDRGE